MKPWAEWFYKSKAWKDCRKAYVSNRVAIDGGLCEMCQEAKGYIVHHVIELNPININDPFISLNHDNLQYVCLKCHNKHHRPCGVKREFYFDENGQLIPPP